MSKKAYLLIFVVFVALGVASYFLLNFSIKDMVGTVTLANLTTKAQSAITVLKQYYKEVCATVGMTGAVIFGYLNRLKNRVIASQNEQVENIQDYNTEQAVLISNQTKQIEDLKNQVSTLQVPNLQIQELTVARDEAQRLVTQQTQEITGYKATIQDLHRVIEGLKQKTVTVTQVK